MWQDDRRGAARGGARVFWGSARNFPAQGEVPEFSGEASHRGRCQPQGEVPATGGGARVFWGSARNFRASWPIETHAKTATIRS